VADSGRHQLEFPTIEEDACAIVCEGTESSCLGLDRLDTAVKAFAHGVGNAVAKVSERVFKVFFKHFCYFDDRLELTTCCPAVPAIEKLASITSIAPNMPTLAQNQRNCSLIAQAREVFSSCSFKASKSIQRSSLMFSGLNNQECLVPFKRSSPSFTKSLFSWRRTLSTASLRCLLI